MNYQKALDRLRRNPWADKYWDDPRRDRVMSKLLRKVLANEPYPGPHRWAETMWL
jgi:hypothetical protein